MLGTFPAAALMYRMGYLKRATPAVIENRSLADMWNRKSPVIAEEASYDPNRDSGDIATGSAIKAGIPPSAFMVGPVQVAFGADSANSKAIQLPAYTANGQIKSDTGEILADPDKGFVTVDSPCAQGVTAFFDRKRSFKLADVTFASGNDYGAALVVSMDGEPIKTSKKVLVQFGTKSRPTGWIEKQATISLDGGKTTPGFEVVNFGKAPWQVVSADLTVEIANPALRKCTVLDANGNAVKTIPLAKTANGVRFQFPSEALYVVLE